MAVFLFMWNSTRFYNMLSTSRSCSHRIQLHSGVWISTWDHIHVEFNLILQGWMKGGTPSMHPFLFLQKQGCGASLFLQTTGCLTVCGCPGGRCCCFSYKKVLALPVENSPIYPCSCVWIRGMNIAKGYSQVPQLLCSVLYLLFQQALKGMDLVTVEKWWTCQPDSFFEISASTYGPVIILKNILS